MAIRQNMHRIMTSILLLINDVVSLRCTPSFLQSRHSAQSCLCSTSWTVIGKTDFFHPRAPATACKVYEKLTETIMTKQLSGAAVLRTFIKGKEDGPTVLFVHGFPDDHTMWDKQVAHLEDRFRCVTVDLPGFSAEDRGVERWGYATDEVVRRLERTIEAAGNGQPIYIVAHDWGCIYSYLLEAKRPELVRKMVAMDVSGEPNPGLPGLLVIVAYQLWLIMAFLLGGPIGNFMASLIVRWFNIPSPTPRKAVASMCYPYCIMWKDVIMKGGARVLMPKCPILYMYGCAGPKKLMMFQTPRWIEKVEKKDCSSVVAFEEGSHWMMLDSAEEVNKELDAFLET